MDAAIHVLSRRGYKKTVIADIAKEAGAAPGLVHYYFESKRKLLEEVGEKVAESLRSSGAAEATSIADAFSRHKQLLRDRPDIIDAYIQLVGLCLNDEILRLAICHQIRAERSALAALMPETLVRAGTNPEAANRVAAVTISLVLGSIFAKPLAPDFDVNEAIDTVGAMMSKLAAG